MSLKCLERSDCKADAEWLELYDEDRQRVHNEYCALVTSFLTAPDLQYAQRVREELRRIEEDWLRLIYLRHDAERVRLFLPVVMVAGR